MNLQKAISPFAFMLGALSLLAASSIAFSFQVPLFAHSPQVNGLMHLVPVESVARKHAKSAQAALKEGNDAVLLPEKISHYCSALSQTGLALEEEPFNTRYLLNWANIRQLLGSTQCAEPYTSGDTVSTLDTALVSTPKDPAVLYSAGLIYLWSNRKDKAREMFGKVLAYGLQLSEGQQAVVLSSLEKPEDVSVVIPPKFPHVYTWQKLIEDSPVLNESEESSKKTEQALGLLQVQALSENRSELDAGIITTGIFESRLLKLIEITSSSTARRLIDSEFSKSIYPESDTHEHSFFLHRSGLEDLKIVRTFQPLDTRPNKTSLVRWARKEEVNFATSYSSLGFFLAGATPVSLISLQSNAHSPAIEASQVKLYISFDNQAWKDISDEAKFTSLRVLDYPWISIALSTPRYAPYWKIHLAGTEKTRTFKNATNRIVRAFGISSEEAHVR